MDCLVPFLHSTVRAARQLSPGQVLLIKQNRVEEFNPQFKDIADRGGFREMTQEDLESWKEPFNYIYIHGRGLQERTSCHHSPQNMHE